VNLAVGLALAGKKVGLLDVDVHGPSVPRLLSLAGADPHMEPGGMEPVPWGRNLGVMSLGFLLKDPEQAVVWRGPVKGGLIRQFLADVFWGELDFLVVDCPPGTGDEPMSVLQFLGPAARAVIVTTPQAVAVDDVRRSVSFVRLMGNPLLGLVENMSGFVCKHCGQVEDIFASGGGEKLAQEMGADFLGRIPLDPELVRSADQGYPLLKVDKEGHAAKALLAVVDRLLALDAARPDASAATPPELPDQGAVRIALPLDGAMLSENPAACKRFLLVDVDKTAQAAATEPRDDFPTAPGLWAGWLADQGVNVLLARGLSAADQAACAARGVAVAQPPAGSPDAALDAYLSGALGSGQ
jgi:MinD-like ATPase involved in chromosome partitioning or flagellar assembly/predicted Fe-Mo cluster-binding NifX family protein